MKIISHLIILSFLGLFMVSCSTGQQKVAEGTIAEDLSVEEFAKYIDGAQLLDVRTPDEWSEGIIEGATMANIHEDDFDANLAKLDKEKPVAVYCRSGGRSGKAMAKMNQLGFKEVYSLKGGIGAWREADNLTVNP
ncbi:MAG: rhodanese-related sulfurtransferase [Bacteroidia bacterium]|jgi:rhodanese-related sulfurtransferase